MSSLVKTYPKSGKPTGWKKSFQIDKVKLRRNVCSEDYFEFCRTFWGTVIAEVPNWNWHIRVMCREIQKVMERVFEFKPKEYDLIQNVPPGSTKSTVNSILLQPWCWTRLPSLRFLGGSYDNDLSLDFGNKARRVIKHPLYQETFPTIQIAGDQDTKGYFANTLGGERRATSTGASIIGRHAHVHVVDDPINPKGVRSEVELRLANQWMTETLPSRCVDQSITPLILVMQRLAIDDPTGERLNRKSGVPCRHICLPAEDSELVRPVIFRSKYKEGLLDPKRLPRKILEVKFEELGSFGYAGQFEQNPVPISGGMFKWDMIQILSPPPVALFKQVYRWWDKAASTDKRSAYTSGVLMGVLNEKIQPPRYWILDVARGRWDTSHRESIIRATADMDHETWGSKYHIGLEQEPGSAGKDSSLATIINLEGYKVIAERATGEKEERAVPFSSQVNIGNVAMVRGLWNKEYLDEMKQFGGLCKYKDQIDASSGAFNKLFRKKWKAGAAGF